MELCGCVLCVQLKSLPPCRYIPAEILRGDYSQLAKADMFMLGITLYELTSRQPLPTGKSQVGEINY